MKRLVFFLTIIMATASTMWGQQRITNNRTNSMGIGDRGRPQPGQTKREQQGGDGRASGPEPVDTLATIR